MTDQHLAILRAMATDHLRDGKLRLHTVAPIRGRLPPGHRDGDILEVLDHLELTGHITREGGGIMLSPAGLVACIR
ncbi:hypothetical protein [Ancylobacter mangrovi]|uniref:hypothetical protein n=1 Tax=Ancylobacter mangrovi TaxID=2972472 RepID=UPI002161B41B|nr:hypothetical protein [Ancylobacter mangrovi]MCS0501364.1 hypothetical protein [Ancylobacter mangrovi]